MSETAALSLTITSVDGIIQDVENLTVAANATQQELTGNVPELVDTKLERRKSHFRKRYHHKRRFSFVGTAAEVANEEGDNKLPLDFVRAEKENTAPVDEHAQDAVAHVPDSPDEPISLKSSKLENKKKKNGYYFRRRKGQYKKKESKLGTSGTNPVPSDFPLDVVASDVVPDEELSQPLTSSVGEIGPI